MKNIAIFTFLLALSLSSYAAIEGPAAELAPQTITISCPKVGNKFTMGDIVGKPVGQKADQKFFKLFSPDIPNGYTVTIDPKKGDMPIKFSSGEFKPFPGAGGIMICHGNFLSANKNYKVEAKFSFTSPVRDYWYSKCKYTGNLAFECSGIKR